MSKPSTANKFIFFAMLFYLFFPFFSGYLLYYTLWFIDFTCSLLGIGPSFMANLDPTFDYIIIQMYLLVIPIAGYFLFTRNKVKDIVPHKRLSFLSILLCIGIGFVLQFAVSFFSVLGNLFFENYIGEYVDSFADYSFFLFTILIAVIPAIFEELTFRGILFAGYKKVDVKILAIVNGFLFGIFHGNLQQFMYTFPGGVIFTLLVYYSDSIYSSMIAHFSLNFSNVLLVRLLDWGEALEDMVEDVVQEPALQATVEEVIEDEIWTIGDEILYLIDSLRISIYASVILGVMFYAFIELNKKNRVNYQEETDEVNKILEEMKMGFAENAKDLSISEIPVELFAKPKPKIITWAFKGAVILFIVEVSVEYWIPYLFAYLEGVLV